MSETTECPRKVPNPNGRGAVPRSGARRPSTVETPVLREHVLRFDAIPNTIPTRLFEDSRRVNSKISVEVLLEGNWNCENNVEKEEQIDSEADPGVTVSEAPRVFVTGQTRGLTERERRSRDRLVGCGPLLCDKAANAIQWKKNIFSHPIVKLM